MIQAEGFFADGNGRFEQSLGVVRVTGLAQYAGETAQATRGIRMLGAKHLLADRERALKERTRPRKIASNSHFGGERDFEGECDLLNRGAFRQCAGRGESDSSSVWERSRTLYRGCGRPVRVCRTSGAGKTSITSWPISAWRRFHRFLCQTSRFSSISGTWRAGTALAPPPGTRPFR